MSALCRAASTISPDIDPYYDCDRPPPPHSILLPNPETRLLGGLINFRRFNFYLKVSLRSKPTRLLNKPKISLWPLPLPPLHPETRLCLLWRMDEWMSNSSWHAPSSYPKNTLPCLDSIHNECTSSSPPPCTPKHDSFYCGDILLKTRKINHLLAPSSLHSQNPKIPLLLWWTA